jgi:ATP-dependent RNA helicase RhlE
MTKFADLPLIEPLQKALQQTGYETPTPIQAQAIPRILEGRDILGVAQTGTGKTAAFSLPILQILAKRGTRPEPKTPRALILTPTRELAIQIHDSLKTYGQNLRITAAVIYGGVGQGQQVRELTAGVDILVATPGRLMDLCKQKHLHLNKVEIFVLDEADRMLDMGFIQDVKRILPLLPKHRHNLFFSATMPPEVQTLASGILTKPHKIEVTPQSTTAEKVDQSVMFVERAHKLELLVHLLKNPQLDKVLVFMQMKHGANRVVEKLTKQGFAVAGIHGDKTQGARQRALEDFRSGKVRVLVATDIAARGLDIDGISHVINFELPHQTDSYVHRIGRTARAGAEGKSISFCTAEERITLKTIERITRQQIPVVTDHPFHSEAAGTGVTSASGGIGSQRARAGGGPRGGNGGGPRAAGDKPVKRTSFFNRRKFGATAGKKKAARK